MVAVHEREFDVATLPGEVLEDSWEELVAVTDVEGDVGERCPVDERSEIERVDLGAVVGDTAQAAALRRADLDR